MPSDFTSWLATQSGTIALALVSGAGGSVLLELLWRPRRVRRRVAALLAVEVELNTNLLAVYASMAGDDPTQVGADFELSTIVWDAAKESLAELDEPVLRQVVTLYGTINELNADIRRFHLLAEGYDLDAMRRGQTKQMDLAHRLTVNLGVILGISVRARDMGRKLLPALQRSAGRGVDTSRLLTDAQATERAKAQLARSPNVI